VPAAATGFRTPAAQHGSDTILVVEDEPAVLALVAEMLQSKGYNVMAAASAEEAMQISERFPGAIDLLLTDLSLPEINGVTLTAELTKLRPAMKTIHMSGHSERWLPGGSSIPLLQKPFNPSTLYQMVFDVLKSKP